MTNRNPANFNLGRNPGWLVIGYAQASGYSATGAAGVMLNITLKVDPDTGEILSVGSNAQTDLVRKWISELLTGANICGDLTPLISLIDKQYIGGKGAKAIEQAIRDAWDKAAHSPIGTSGVTGDAGSGDGGPGRV